jgi:hypothetical protein
MARNYQVNLAKFNREALRLGDENRSIKLLLLNLATYLTSFHFNYGIQSIQNFKGS